MMRRRYPCPAIILAALLLAWSATPSMAAEPPKEPILRIETGMHTAMIHRIGFVNELASAENGAVVFASSTGRQYSLEDPAWGNGAFTKAVVEGLSGKADYAKKGKITINMLDLFISERVKELTKGQQTPTTTKPQTVPDFPIAVVF